MAAGDNSALGTLARLAQAGDRPADPIFVDRITVLGDADYATAGTSGLLAALRTATDDSRVIIGAICTCQRTAGTPNTAVTNKYSVTYDPLFDKIQLFIADDADLDDEVTAGAGGTLVARVFEFLVFSK